jgi:hypothetical protein
MMRAFRTDDLLQLHEEKILARLYTHLTSGKPGKALAWRIPPPPNRPHRAFRLALHPVLGNAILFIKALALATSMGLDILTDSTHVHEVVAAESEADVFDAFRGDRVVKKAPRLQDTVDAPPRDCYDDGLSCSSFDSEADW